MSSSSDELFSVEDVQANLDVLRAVDDEIVEAIDGAERAEVLKYLIRVQ